MINLWFLILGTTWVQEIVYLIKNDVNVKLAKAIIMEER